MIEKVLDEAAQLIHKNRTSDEAEIRHGVLLCPNFVSQTLGLSLWAFAVNNGGIHSRGRRQMDPIPCQTTRTLQNLNLPIGGRRKGPLANAKWSTFSYPSLCYSMIADSAFK